MLYCIVDAMDRFRSVMIVHNIRAFSITRDCWLLENVACYVAATCVLRSCYVGMYLLYFCFERAMILLRACSLRRSVKITFKLELSSKSVNHWIIVLVLIWIHGFIQLHIWFTRSTSYKVHFNIHSMAKVLTPHITHVRGLVYIFILPEYTSGAGMLIIW